MVLSYDYEDGGTVLDLTYQGLVTGIGLTFGGDVTMRRILRCLAAVSAILVSWATVYAQSNKPNILGSPWIRM